MSIKTNSFSPTLFDRSPVLNRLQRPAAAPATAPAGAPAAEPPKLETLEARVRDTLSLGQGSPAAAAAGELNEALRNLRQLTNSGPNASVADVVKRFQSETLPRNLQSLATGINELQTRISALPADAPERESLGLQLRALQGTQQLYLQAERLLAASPLLNPPAGPVTGAAESAAPAAVAAPGPAAVTTPGAPVAPLAPAAGAPAGAAPAAPTAPEPPSLSTLAHDGLIPAQANRNYSHLDAFYEHPDSPSTLFNQRRQALQTDIHGLDTRIQGLREQGGAPEEIARLERSKALLQKLGTIYGGIGGLTGTGSRGIAADVQRLNGQIAEASQALTDASGDLDPATVEGIQGQLSDLSTIAATYDAIKDRPVEERLEHNLGRFINTTYKRLAQIEVGQRQRSNETADITGALQSITNDKADIGAFLERFASLRTRIRAGLSPAEARAIAAQSTRGTSAAFQASYQKLVDAELKLQEAKVLSARARSEDVRARAGLDRGEAALTTANGAIATGNRENQGVRAALGHQDLAGARAGLGRAKAAQAAGATALGDARAGLSEADAAHARAQADLSASRAAEARARADATQVQSLPFGRQLRPASGEVLRQADAVRGERARVEADVVQTGARLTAAHTQLTQTETAQQGLATTTAGSARALATAETAARRQQENQHQLDQLNQFLDQDKVGSFKIDLTAGIKVGLGEGNFEASATASLTASLFGEKNLEGTYAVNVRFGGQISAEVKAYLLELKGTERFEGSIGIRLRSPQEVRELSRLLNNVTGALSQHGVNSSQAAAARQQFQSFLSLHKETSTSTVRTVEVAYGHHDRAEVTNTTTFFETGVLEDENHNGRRDNGEKVATERTRLDAYEFKGEHHGHELGIKSEVYRNRENGQITYAELEFAAPVGGGIPAYVQAVQQATQNSPYARGITQRADFAQFATQLAAANARALPGQEFKGVASYHNGHVTFRVLASTSVSSAVKQDIRVNPSTSLELTAAARLEVSTIVATSAPVSTTSHGGANEHSGTPSSHVG